MSWQPDDLHALDAKTRLQAELDDYPDLIAARQLAASAQTLPFSQREKVA